MEQVYHGSLVSCTGIRQIEWHDVVGISSPISGERHFGFVPLSHLNLIITRESIHKGEEYVGRDVIYQGIDIWQGKIILRAGSIQISM